MLKRIIITISLISMLAMLASCGSTKTKILHCDNCKVEVEVEESSNMTEDWMIYCEKCNEELFGNDPILGAK